MDNVGPDSIIKGYNAKSSTYRTGWWANVYNRQNLHLDVQPCHLIRNKAPFVSRY
jgi:hypothetical protein